MKTAVLIVLTALLLVGCMSWIVGETISGAKAKKIVADGGRLVDVRTPEEFKERHIEGAQNVPVGELESRLGELSPKDRPIVVHCRSGVRSAKAKKILLAAGFREVYNLGGIDKW